MRDGGKEREADRWTDIHRHTQTICTGIHVQTSRQTDRQTVVELHVGTDKQSRLIDRPKDLQTDHVYVHVQCIYLCVVYRLDNTNFSRVLGVW